MPTHCGADSLDFGSVGGRRLDLIGIEVEGPPLLFRHAGAGERGVGDGGCHERPQQVRGPTASMSAAWIAGRAVIGA